MARKADQELNDAVGLNQYGQYKNNVWDAIQQYWVIILLVIVLLLVVWKYGMKK